MMTASLARPTVHKWRALSGQHTTRYLSKVTQSVMYADPVCPKLRNHSRHQMEELNNPFKLLLNVFLQIDSVRCKEKFVVRAQQHFYEMFFFKLTVSDANKSSVCVLVQNVRVQSESLNSKEKSSPLFSFSAFKDLRCGLMQLLTPQ